MPARRRRPDSLAVEEPLQIRLDGDPLTVTMRTPGDDMDLAAGFLVSTGTVRRPGDIRAMRFCAGADADGVNSYNVLDVSLAPDVTPPAPRAFLTTSACGVCGASTVEEVSTAAAWPVAGDPVRLHPSVLAALPGRLREAQRAFAATGGVHAAGLFSPDGRLVAVREDVGRHNAVDKVVGWAYRDGALPLRGLVLVVSGRASFELTQKALMAGIPALAAVSAPSSLAVDLATAAGLTLVGFLRGPSMNVYAGEARLTGPPE